MVLQTVSDLGVQAWVSITTSSTLQLGARGRARGAAARGTWGAALARPRERTDATKNLTILENLVGTSHGIVSS